MLFIKNNYILNGKNTHLPRFLPWIFKKIELLNRLIFDVIPAFLPRKALARRGRAGMARPIISSRLDILKVGTTNLVDCIFKDKISWSGYNSGFEVQVWASALLPVNCITTLFSPYLTTLFEFNGPPLPFRCMLADFQRFGNIHTAPIPDFFLGRSMDVFITRLRKYLSGDQNITIQSVRGVGIMLEEKKNDWWWFHPLFRWGSRNHEGSYLSSALFHLAKKNSLFIIYWSSNRYTLPLTHFQPGM